MLVVHLCAVDGLAVEHFIYADNFTNVYSSILFTAFISHGHLHDSFMKSAIDPLIYHILLFGPCP